MIYSATGTITTSAALEVYLGGHLDYAVGFELLEVRIGQRTLFGDANAGAVEAIFTRASVSSWSGTSLTVSPYTVDDATDLSSIILAKYSTGAVSVAQTFKRETFNLQNGYVWRTTPESRVIVTPYFSANYRLLGFELTAPPASVTYVVTILFRMFGVSLA